MAREIRARDGEAILVFVSCPSEQALDTVDFETFRFLVKPVTQKWFDEVFGKAVRKYQAMHACFIIKWKGEPQHLRVESIHYVKHIHKYIAFHTEDDRLKTVSTLQETLVELAPCGLIQTHQGYLVNMARIKRFDG